jgi:hypothetical protein
MQSYQPLEHQFIQCPNVYQTTILGSHNGQGQPTIQRPVQNPIDGRCFNCGEKGHFASACPKLCNCPNQTPATNIVPNRNGNPTPMRSRQNFFQGRVNHVTVMRHRRRLMLFTVRSCSTLLLLLFCLIMELRIHLFLLHMWRSIIYP